MRIITLPQLILEEECEDHALKDCDLVIDGKQFFFNTYQSSNLPYLFGCEANEYAEYLIRARLSKYKKANIKCHFVFKGGQDCIETKLDVLNKWSDPNPNSSYDYVAPIFMREVHQQVLEDKGLKYSTSAETHQSYRDDIVELAQKLKCPVLGWNIEYCFMNVTYVMSPSLKNDGYIMCRKFELENFLNKHSLTKKKVAIFVTLSNTYLFPHNVFDKLVVSWNVYDENLREQHKKLLKWLSKHDEDEAVNIVTKFILSENETLVATFHNQVAKHFDNMTRDSAKCNIVSEYLYNNCQLSIGREDPLWFEKGVASQNIPIPYINLYKHEFILGSNAIEKKTSTDSIMPSIDIIKYAYNLLTNFETTFISLYRNKENILEIFTEDLNIRKPLYPCKKSVFENGWQYIAQLKLFEHFLTQNNLNRDIANKCPQQDRLLLFSLAYFARKKQVEGLNVTKEICCFIICSVILNVSKKMQYRYTYKSELNDGIRYVEYDRMRHLTKKYFICDEDEAKTTFDRDIFKKLVELQYCLLHMNYLNTLCGAPYLPTQYQNTFNGTFIYKLLHEMGDQDADIFIENLFKTTPEILKRIKFLIVTFKQLSAV